MQKQLSSTLEGHQVSRYSFSLCVRSTALLIVSRDKSVLQNALWYIFCDGSISLLNYLKSKRTQHEKEKQAKSYRRDPEYQRALSLKLDWIWTARDRPLQVLKNKFTTILQSFSPDNQTVTFHISWFSPVFLNSWQYVMMDDMTAAQKVKPKHLDCPNYSSESTSARRLVSLSEFEPFSLFFYILKVLESLELRRYTVLTTTPWNTS